MTGIIKLKFVMHILSYRKWLDFSFNIQIEQTFERTLKEKKGYIIKPVKEDGACLFRAIGNYKVDLRWFLSINLFEADQVFGDEDMHAVVRQNCMDYIVSCLIIVEI